MRLPETTPGFCTPCTNKTTDEYFTADGGIGDACPTAPCANLVCAGGRERPSEPGLPRQMSDEEVFSMFADELQSLEGGAEAAGMEGGLARQPMALEAQAVDAEPVAADVEA